MGRAIAVSRIRWPPHAMLVLAGAAVVGAVALWLRHAPAPAGREHAAPARPTVLVFLGATCECSKGFVRTLAGIAPFLGPRASVLAEVGSGKAASAFGSVPEAADATVSGEVHAVVADAQSLEYFATTHPSVAVKVLGETFEKRRYAFAVRLGDEDLLRRLNVGILSLREGGALDRARSRWFGH